MLNHLKLKHSSDDPYEETELSLYKRERCDPNVNPLKWWNENSIKYPRLSVLARQYLSIPGTSVPSERIFSATGLLVNKLRNRLLLSWTMSFFLIRTMYQNKQIHNRP